VVGIATSVPATPPVISPASTEHLVTDPNPYDTPLANNDIRRPASLAKRPIGVWILTVCLALFAGLIPAAIAVVIYAQVEVRESLGMTAWVLTLSVGLGIAIISTSILAWRGNNVARYLLLALAVIHYAMLAYNNFMLASSGAMPEELAPRTWGRAFRSIFWIAILVWYFGISHRPRAFYHRSKIAM
jgi:hypothetical protein